MRVLIINTSERIGGAAVAASRLMESLKNNGIKAKMLVRDKQTNQISVVRLERNWLTVWKFMWERIVIWKANHFRKNNLFAVDIANTGTDITTLPEFTQADIIHLHWINQGMLSLKDIHRILESATTPVNAPTISKNAITASFYTPEAARKICPPGYSTKKRRFTNKLPLHLSLVAIGWKKGQKAAPCYATRPS